MEGCHDGHKDLRSDWLPGPWLQDMNEQRFVVNKCPEQSGTYFKRLTS